jgi:hypothetical protein
MKKQVQWYLTDFVFGLLFDLEEWSSRFLRKFCELLPENTASHHVWSLFISIAFINLPCILHASSYHRMDGMETLKIRNSKSDPSVADCATTTPKIYAVKSINYEAANYSYIYIYICSPFSCNVLSFRCKYSFWHPLFKHPQPIIFH